MWGFLVATLLVWTGFNGAWNFVGLKIEEPLLIGVGTALGGFTEVGVMRLSSRLHRRLGLRKVYALGCVVYATGFLLWGLVESRTIVSLLAVFEGAGFSLLFTTSILVVGKLLPSSLYSTGNSIAAMVGFGIGPIIGAGARRRGLRTARVDDPVHRLLGHRPARRRRRDGRAADPLAGYAAAGAAPARGRLRRSPDGCDAPGVTCALCSKVLHRGTMGASDPTGRWHLMPDNKNGNKNGSEDQPLSGLVDKAKEVGGTVAEKAGPAMVKAKEVGGTVAEKAGPAMVKAKEVGGTVAEKAGPAMEKAKEVGGTVVEKAGPAMEKAKEVGGTVGEKAGPAVVKAKEVGGIVSEMTGPIVHRAKEVAGTVLDKVAPAVEKAMESATEFVEKAVDRAKELLANKDEDKK